MESHLLRPLGRLEIPVDRVGDHLVQFGQRVGLRGDAAPARLVIPSGHESPGFRTRFHAKSYLYHAEKICALAGRCASFRSARPADILISADGTPPARRRQPPADFLEAGEI